MIPKILHFYWESQDKDNISLPLDSLNIISEWKKKHPDYLIKIWSYNEIMEDMNLSFIDGLKESFLSCNLPAMRSDIARLFVLYKYGGIYNDLKNYPNQSFLDQFNDAKFIISEHPPTIDRISFNEHFSNCFIGSIRQNKLILTVLNKIINNIQNRVQRSVVDVTGLEVIKLLLKSIDLTNKDMIILDSETAWGKRKIANISEEQGYMQRVSANYNGKNNNLHWSKLQKISGLYREIN